MPRNHAQEIIKLRKKTKTTRENIDSRTIGDLIANFVSLGPLKSSKTNKTNTMSNQVEVDDNTGSDVSKHEFYSFQRSFSKAQHDTNSFQIEQVSADLGFPVMYPPVC